MYSVVKNVISGGNFNLTAVLEKINILWAEGRLTDDERSELKELARAGATPQEGADLFAKLQELEMRIRALEEKQSTDASETETATDYVAGHWYYNGDKCIWNGESYICTAPEGTVCVWSPEEYPAYWTKEE